MRKSLLLACCWLALTGLPAAANLDADLLAEFRRGGLQESEIETIMSQLADVSGPRLSGSSGLQRAQQWAMSQFRKWGLQEIRLESFGPPIPSWEVERCTLELLQPHYANLQVFPRAWSPGLSRVVEGRPLHVVVEKEEDFGQYRGKLRGAIVLLGNAPKLQENVALKPKRYTPDELAGMLQPEPERQGPGLEQRRQRREAYLKWRTQVWDFLKQERVQTVIEAAPGGGGAVKVGGGSPTNPPGAPNLLLAPEHFGLLTRLIAAGSPPQLRLQFRTRTVGKPLPDTNLFADIPGTDPLLKDEIVLIGGHLDSWLSGTGAADNAAGSAVAMEAMRLIRTFGQAPRRTIRIALWSGEEQGLLGSRAWVQRYLAPKDGTHPELFDKISAYYNVDNGSGKIRGIHLQGNLAAGPIFEQIVAPLTDLDVTTVSPRPTWSTDHIPFDNVGIPAFQFIQDPLAYDTLTHHSNVDTLEHSSIPDLQQASVVLAWFAWSTAMLDERLPRKEPPPPAQ